MTKGRWVVAAMLIAAACGKKDPDHRAAPTPAPTPAPAVDAAAPVAIDAAPATAPPPAGPAVTVKAGETPLGCVAWSSKDHAAACVTGAAGADGDLQFAFIGGGPGGQPVAATLGEADAAALNKLLADGGYAALGAATPVPAGTPLALGKVTVTLTDQVTPSAGENQAPTHRYALVVRCGGVDTSLAADAAEGVTPSAQAWQQGDHVVIQLELALAREGEYGTTYGAAVVDGATCAVASGLD